MKKNKSYRPVYFAYPYLAISLVFVILPLVLVFIYAFRGSEGGFTWDNIVATFSVKNLVLLLKTVGIALLVTVVSLLIAYPVAMVLASSPFNKLTILALLFVIPMWMNFVLRVIALKDLLYMMGISNGLFASVVGMVYDFFPFMLLPIYTVLCNMDKSYIEASTDLGAGKVRTFATVTLPLSLPGVASGVTMVFMPVFSAYAITDMMGDVNTSVLGGKINLLFGLGSWGTGSALAFLLLVIVILSVVITNLVARRAGGGEVKGVR